MEITTFELNINRLDDLRKYLCNEFSIGYQKTNESFFVLGFEEYYFRSNSTQLNLIVATLDYDMIKIDAIGSAGGSGLFNLNLGSEKNFINKFSKVLQKFKDTYKIP
ncbi:MAG TPA: DUF6054 family protein [bacterium]|nr:DUF6054 family protein [bacterium]